MNSTEKSTTKIIMAVRDFALPVPRTGSIDVHSGYGNATAWGQAIHAEVQEQRAAENRHYHAEMPLAWEFEKEEFCFVVSGRADGVITGVLPRIEEIKSSFDVGGLKKALRLDPFHPYWLQLAMYVEIYQRKFGLKPQASLHLVSLRHGLSSDLDLPLTETDFAEWLKRRLDLAVIEARAQRAIEARRKKAASAFRFPFEEPRPGQIELIAAVESACADGQPLLAQAPTGLGKTMAILYPMAKEAFERGQKVIYVTPKNSQHAVAEEGVQHLQAQGVKFKAQTITAKSKLCLKPEPLCNPQYCEYAKDHYTKVSAHDLVKKALKKKNLSARTFRKLGEEYQVCPFELSLETITKVDAVIADYNYVFSPYGILGKLTDTSGPNKANLIVDEVHNLPSRAADYQSKSISTISLQNMLERMAAVPAPWGAEGLSWIEKLQNLIRKQETADKKDGLVKIDITAFESLDEKIGRFLYRYLESDVEIGSHDPILRLARDMAEFTEALAYVGEEFFTTRRDLFGDHVILKVTCCDASAWLREVHKAFANVVGFSATLKPFEYYARLSGFDVAKVLLKEFKSPFTPDRRKILVIPQISTKWNDRATNTQKIADVIARVAARQPGNYFAFFPSFEFMHQVARVIQAPDFEIRIQEREMSRMKVKEAMRALRDQDRPILFFAVQGGVFSEGVDYPGEMLIGAFIVGPGLPTFDTEREQLRKYYDTHYGSGFDYAYTYPAMTKVVQSAGRVIRSPKDRGLIVLMDRRFTHGSYVKSMPSDWFENSVQDLVSGEILKSVDEFWQQQAEEDL